MEQMNLFEKTVQMDQNNEDQARIRHLRRTPHIFWEDPGHGWLEVEIADLDILKIKKEISGYSYRKNEKAYLEEDMDAFNYTKALWGKLYGSAEYELWRSMTVTNYQENIFIRSCRYFKVL